MPEIIIDDKQLTVSRSTVRHAVMRKNVIRKLLEGLKQESNTDDMVLVELLVDYAHIVTQTTYEHDAPEWLATPTDSATVLADKFNLWCDTPESVYKSLFDAIKEAEQPLVADHLTPSARPKKKSKQATD